MLSKIFASIGGEIVDRLLGRITGVFESYFKKQVSMEELRSQVLQSMLDTFAEVEKSHADALAKTFESFQQTLRTSPELRRMYAAVVYSQLFVLFWSQWVVPMAHWLGYTGAWKAGTSAEWAYLLIGGLCGAAPMLLRGGPGAGSLKDQLKSLIAK
jgi:hypothetical protein